jgi:diguanylate cyclase (GGDEF)-like protein
MTKDMATLASLRALVEEGPDPYDQIDTASACRMGGALYLVAVGYAALLAPLTEPRGGTLGWVLVAAALVAGLASALLMLNPRASMPPSGLLAFAYASIALVAVMQWLNGPEAPAVDLLLIVCLYNGCIHPWRRVLGVLAAVSAVSLSPLLYADLDAAWALRRTSELGLWLGLGALAVVWSARVRRLRAALAVARDEAATLARVDPLTGLGNRRALDEAVVVAAALARRNDRPLSALVADVDAFKPINDAWGHQAGDAVIRAVAEAFADTVRTVDPCFRWGGDELVALLPDATLETGWEVAGRVAEEVGRRCRRPDGRPLEITIGCAELRPGETGAELLARADDVLMAAKAERPRR